MKFAKSRWVSLVLIVACVLGLAPAHAAKPAAAPSAPPLSAAGVKLEAEYSRRLAGLEAEIKKALPAVDEAKQTAYAAARKVEETAKAELANWQKNRAEGEAALVERQARLDKAMQEKEANERALKQAEQALTQAKAAMAKATTSLGLETLLSSDSLDAKLARRAVMTEATPRGLAAFADQGPEHKQLIERLLTNDPLAVQIAVADGAKDGKYGEAMRIYDAIQEASDKAREGTLQRLAMAIALEHAVPVAQRNAVGKPDAPATVDPVARYRHFEKAFLDGELDAAFKDLTVWDLRMVVNGEEPDEMLAWGREMLRNYRPDHITTPDDRWRYVGAVRTDVKYGSQDCKYDQDELQFFQNILMNGGVCGRRAFFGRFILRAFGVPTTARPQKGHAALVHWTPAGWVVCLGAAWGNGRTASPYGPDLDFLATTQARACGPDYLQVKRGHWIGGVFGEPWTPGENAKSPPGFWNGVALLTQRRLIEAAGAHALAAVGTDIGEANVSKEKEIYAAVKITDADRTITAGKDGTITIPAVATTEPKASTGKILLMTSPLGGTQLHYGRNGGPQDFAYAFEAPAAGRYQLTARVVTPSWKQSLTVTANDAGEPVAMPLPFTVGMWETTEPVEIDLVKGRNVLRFSRPDATAGVTIKEFSLSPLARP